MRFLCFHGRGTNAEIFKIQTASLRSALGSDHEFVFINGGFSVTDIPGLNAPNASQIRDRRAFVPLEEDPRVYHSIISELRAFILSKGPFDGLMGFSEGAGLAATIAAENSKRPFAKLRSIILFCSQDAIALESNPVRTLDPEIDGQLVDMPSTHIWSTSDNVASERPYKVSCLFNEDVREIVVHNLGHDIPGSRSETGMGETVIAIERTIERGKQFQ
ncbi:hypothetical protein PG995_014288 [Apiospora arundinis]